MTTCGVLGIGGPDVLDDEPLVEAGADEQQAGDELAGRRGVDAQRTAAHRARAVHRERQPAGLLRRAVVDGDPEVAQGA